MTCPLSIKTIDVADVGERLAINIKVRNEDKRPLHCVASIRSFHYDEATGTLKLFLINPEKAIALPGVPGNILPNFIVVDPGSDGLIRVTLPRIGQTFDYKATDNNASQGDIKLRQLDFYKVKNIELTLACNDVPFYCDTRGKKEGIITAEEHAAQLHKWDKWLIKATSKVKAGK